MNHGYSRSNSFDPIDKKSKGTIISRMKRSLSTTNKPQAPKSYQPRPYSPSPTTHMNFETFSSTSSNLSIYSYSTGRRVSSTSTFDSITNIASSEKLQVKNMFESRLTENENRLSMVSNDNTPQKHTPSPAMYWSCPKTFGVNPPDIRAHASVVYDDKMYLYGGVNRSTCSDILYTFELDTYIWSIPRVYGHLPPPCKAHSLNVNPNNGKIYLFGGGDELKYHNHLYVLDTHTMIWSKPKTTGDIPSERRAHTAIIWQQDLYVFGGGNGTTALNDLYKLNLKTYEWSRVITSGPSPNSRGYHTGNLVGNKLVVYGGSDGKECFGCEIHVLDLETSIWHPVYLDEQLPRLSHSTLCIGSYLFIIAGHDGIQYCNDLHMLNLVNMSWETKAIYGQAPTSRGYHTTVLYDSRIFLFGGYNGKAFFNDICVLDLSSYAYLPQIVNFIIDTSQ